MARPATQNAPRGASRLGATADRVSERAATVRATLTAVPALSSGDPTQGRLMLATYGAAHDQQAQEGPHHRRRAGCPRARRIRPRGRGSGRRLGGRRQVRGDQRRLRRRGPRRPRWPRPAAGRSTSPSSTTRTARPTRSRSPRPTAARSTFGSTTGSTWSPSSGTARTATARRPTARTRAPTRTPTSPGHQDEKSGE